jgi:hypothetical protein
MLSHNKINIFNAHNILCDNLDISNNFIKDVVLTNCTINYLDLNCNLIENVKFINCNIKVLDLSINKIKFFNFDSYPDNIERINLFANRLMDIADMSNTLLKIDLSDNKLRELTYISNKLMYLDISKNFISELDLNIIPSTLKYLDITENKVKNIQNILNYTNITKLIYDTDTIDKNIKNNNVMSPVQKITKSNIFSEQYNYNDKCKSLNENDNLSVNSNINDSENDSELSVKLKINNQQIVKKIQISDEEWDNLDNDETLSALPDSDSDSDSDSEQVDNFSVSSLNNYSSDDEITEVLKKYRDNLHMSTPSTKPLIIDSTEKKNIISNNSFDFLNYESESSSVSDSLPIYETYDLFWNICI